MFGFFDFYEYKNQGFLVYLVCLIFVYKIIDKYINFNIISFKSSIHINNNSILCILYKLYNV